MKSRMKTTVLGIGTFLVMTLTSNAWALVVVDENKSPVQVNGIIAILIGIYRAIVGG